MSKPAYPYFSGSYPAEDVRFLLKPIQVKHTSVSEKELLIQTGQKHYSEMLSHEKQPDASYIALFEQALVANQQRMAEDLITLAEKIIVHRPAGITLVSLARAGTPIGVLLKRVLKDYFAIEVAHYSISIIRDIGIDENALLHILHAHSPESLVFVDGWTGKGVIAKQLAVSLHDFWQKHAIAIAPELYVLADLSGSAFVSASHEDYLIPSSILNATVSGLVSRSVLDKNQLSSHDFHGCHYYQDYLAVDLSNVFIEAIMAKVKTRFNQGLPEAMLEDLANKAKLQQQSQAFLAWIAQMYGINNANLIKPGIGEATRVLLRREADLLLIQNMNDESVKHLIYLANNKHIEIKHYPELPYRAAALIKEIS